MTVDVPRGERRAEGLKAGALGMPAVLMQSITQIAPALAILLNIGFITNLAGHAAPLTFLVAFLIVLLLAVPLGELARVFPSAGGYYTYVTKTVGPRAGMLAAWVYSSIAPMAPAVVGVFSCLLIEGELRARYSVHLPWWVLYIVIILAVGAAAYKGIELSGKLMVALGVAEMAIVAALCLWGVFDPGPGGTNLHGFNPGSASSLNGFYLAVVFSIFAFTGWESAIAVGEESEEPQRVVPRALSGSVIVLGVFLVVCAWGLQLGWGTDDLAGLGTAASPAFDLAHRFWGSATIVLLLAILNSTVAVCLACTTMSTRMWFAMGRSGTLPEGVARLHARNQTPEVAIALQTVLSLVVGFGGAALVGADQIFFVGGLIFTLGYVFVYGIGNIGVVRYFLGAGRAERHVIKHIVFPMLSTLALLWVGYKSLIPLPPKPVGWAPWVAGGWFLAGIALVLRSGRRDRESLVAATADVEADTTVPG